MPEAPFCHLMRDRGWERREAVGDDEMWEGGMVGDKKGGMVKVGQQEILFVILHPSRVLHKNKKEAICISMGCS